jgi:hypothetical protein
MTIMITPFPPLELLQQALHTPHAKGGGGHGDGFGKLMDAQLTNQAVANPQAMAPRPNVFTAVLKAKKDEREREKEDDAREQDEQAANDPMQQQASGQSSRRSLWA